MTEPAPNESRRPATEGREETTDIETVNIPAVFSTHEDAIEAVEDLSSHGLADEHLVEGVQSPADHVLEVDTDRDVLRAIWAGGITGTVAGALIGFLIVAFGQALAGGPVNIGGAIVAGGYGAAGFGFFFGTVVAIAAKTNVLSDEQRWAEVALTAAETLIVVRDHGQEQRVRAILQAHGATMLPTRAA